VNLGDTAAIGVDWGTSSLRAYRLAGDGGILERREAALGIMAIEGGAFDAALEQTIGDWLDMSTSIPVILSGMIGSRQGWHEAPYLACPADVAGLAAALSPVDLARGRRIWIAPGLSHRDAGGTPDVMRGEEVQILGAQDALGQGPAMVCLPGTHSKWARVVGGHVIGFATYMTGEVFEAVRGHTILGRMINADVWDDTAFIDGLERAGEPGGLLGHLFGVRSKGLFGDLDEGTAGAYLSGLMIGHELAAALAGMENSNVALIGAGRLVDLYGKALTHLGHESRHLPSDVAAAGHMRLARALINGDPNEFT
jgi:2-dehydro-3-deoxygalactonokinase